MKPTSVDQQKEDRMEFLVEFEVEVPGGTPHAEVGATPSLTRVYRLEATLGEPLDLGDVAQGRRRIVPLTGGTFTGPELNGTLLPGVSADWQLVLPDGTALADIRYTLQTDDGDLLPRGLPGQDEGTVRASSDPIGAEDTSQRRGGAEKAADDSDRERRIMAFTLRGRCSECVRGRLPLPEALRDELGPLLLAPAVQHLEV
jgi:Protein of unknown function (DUF3237)